MDLELLQRRLGYFFGDRAILLQSLTHTSYGHEHHPEKPLAQRDNERLEFLGDSVLNLAVSRLLFTRLTDLPEGDLSRVRANLVKQDTLHRLALDRKSTRLNSSH